MAILNLQKSTDQGDLAEGQNKNPAPQVPKIPKMEKSEF